MIRLAAARAVPSRPLAALDPSSGPQQKRCKAFARKVDRRGNIYYVPVKEQSLQSSASPSQQQDFYEMPNIVLELDAYGASNVRPYNDADEQRMKARWSRLSKRSAVEARVHRIEDQIVESRRRMDGILSQPTNVWRITPHDLLSAALRGASSLSGQKRGHHETGLHGSNDLLETICRENGIPPSAAGEDDRLLRWMMTRRRCLERSMQHRPEATPSPAQVAAGLKDQKSITGIRRLVFQSFAADTNREGSGPEDGTILFLVPQIRESCERILRQSSSGDVDAVREALTLVANLYRRLWNPNHEGGAALSQLCSFALRLSAAAGCLEAVLQWLLRGFEAGIWSGQAETANDVLASLHLLRKADDAQLILDHRHLFRLLVGIDEGDSFSPNSFRALVMLYSSDSSTVSAQQAWEAYQDYILLLGNMGAARMLWKEWRLSVPGIEERIRGRDGAAGEGVVALFQSAAEQLARRELTADEHRSDLGLAECAARDQSAITMQTAETCRDTAAFPTTKGTLADVRSMLALPLADWIRQLEQGSGRG